MTDFTASRKNMVDCQIQTNGVSMPALLDVLETIPRENFVPTALQSMAYTDEAIRISSDRFLLEPLTHAKMVQALDPKLDDVALDIGGATGYSAAILSPLVSTVIALETSEDYCDDATRHWNKVSVSNAVSVQGDLVTGYAKNAPYNIIFIGGAVAEIPEALTAQLETGGRLIAIVKKPNDVMGQVTLVQKLGDKQFSSYTLFEAGAPYLTGFEPKPAFTF